MAIILMVVKAKARSEQSAECDNVLSHLLIPLSY